jgi:hypothetical protein
MAAFHRHNDVDRLRRRDVVARLEVRSLRRPVVNGVESVELPPRVHLCELAAHEREDSDGRAEAPSRCDGLGNWLTTARLLDVSG